MFLECFQNNVIQYIKYAMNFVVVYQLYYVLSLFGLARNF